LQAAVGAYILIATFRGTPVSQIDAFILPPEQQRVERERLRRLFYAKPPPPRIMGGPTPSRPPNGPPSLTRQLAAVTEPYREQLGRLAAEVLIEWPEVAPSALFGKSRDADDLQAKRCFLTLAKTVTQMKTGKLAPIVGYERTTANKMMAAFRAEAASDPELGARMQRIVAKMTGQAAG
jgi:hypothetical protein